VSGRPVLSGGRAHLEHGISIHTSPTLKALPLEEKQFDLIADLRQYQHASHVGNNQPPGEKFCVLLASVPMLAFRSGNLLKFGLCENEPIKLYFFLPESLVLANRLKVLQGINLILIP
jgi:hypothetical protein